MFLMVNTTLLMFLRVITALLMFLRVITVSYHTVITAIQHTFFFDVWLQWEINNSYTTKKLKNKAALKLK